jgi:hypothetical protein
MEFLQANWLWLLLVGVAAWLLLGRGGWAAGWAATEATVPEALAHWATPGKLHPHPFPTRSAASEFRVSTPRRRVNEGPRGC